MFRNSDNYLAIVKELSKKQYGMTRTELIDSGKVADGKTLTRCLEDLEQCGFIRKYRHFSLKKNGDHYQLIDPMCLFYLTFIDKGTPEL